MHEALPAADVSAHWPIAVVHIVRVYNINLKISLRIVPPEIATYALTGHGASAYTSLGEAQ